jgi:hypothetical protein
LIDDSVERIKAERVAKGTKFVFNFGRVYNRKKEAALDLFTACCICPFCTYHGSHPLESA